MTAQPVLTVSGLNVALSGVRVLSDINFSISAGELVALIGPNGAGKTTLMRAMMRLIPTESGKIELASEAERTSAIGYVPQRQEIDWNYPISIQTLVASAFLPELGMFRRPKARHWQAVYRALRSVGLYELRSRPIGQLSGGQKQRVLIARALATDPSLLLLDEPFTGLDHPNQDSLSDLFCELSSGGVAILMSTHDLTQAIDISSRLLMLNRTVRADGSAGQLRDPQLWIDTYNVRPDSALLRTLGLVMA